MGPADESAVLRLEVVDRPVAQGAAVALPGRICLEGQVPHAVATTGVKCVERGVVQKEGGAEFPGDPADPRDVAVVIAGVV